MITICLLAVCRVLKVWKNSSWVCTRALQELDVVDQQHVDVAIAALEGLRLVVTDRVDEVVGELFRADVEHSSAGIEAARIVTDGVQQVGLAQT